MTQPTPAPQTNRERLADLNARMLAIWPHLSFEEAKDFNESVESAAADLKRQFIRPSDYLYEVRTAILFASRTCANRLLRENGWQPVVLPEAISREVSQ